MAGNGPKIELSVTQVAAATLAAVSAAAAASFLGVAGTIVGAAVMSTVASLGQAVYGHSLRRGRERIRAVLPVTQSVPTLAGRDAPTAAAERPPIGQDRPTADAPPADTDQPPADADRPAGPARPGWRRFTAVAALVFGLALASVTAIELATGKPFSALFGGSHQRGSTLSHVVGGSGSGSDRHDHRSPSTPTTPTRTGESGGPAGQSGSPSPTPSGGSPSPTPTHSPTGEPTPSPSGGAPSEAPTQAPTGGTVPE
ncbi:MAG: hypothetical protein ACJ73S_24145 [Mycobacteriales bacterium]